MAYKFDKTTNHLDANKNIELISKSEDMDIQDILQYSLINKFPLPLVIDNFGNNLIHLTINNPKKIKSEFNKLNFIKFLIQNDVNPDQPNKENQTPLHLACQFQYLTIVELLLELNVNPNYKDSNGLTPLHYLYTGNIKLFLEKEIKEFIVPNKAKDNIINREDLLQLKNKLWEILKDDKYIYFFKSLKNTIEYNITNSPKFKQELSKFKFEELSSSSTSTDNNLINDKYQNWKKSLYNINEKFWNKFSNDDDIILHDFETDSLTIDSTTGIIKNANVKKQIKSELKNTIKKCVEDISKFEPSEYNSELMFNNIISTFLYDIVKNNKLVSFQAKNLILVGNGIQQLSPIYPLYTADYPQIINNPPDIYLLNDKTLINDIITTKYNNDKHKNAIDLADNIIDFNNFSFVGGSRNIVINDDNYSKILEKINNFDSINKKVIFILVCYYQNNFINVDLKLNNIITEIDTLTNDNYSTIFDNLINILMNVIPIMLTNNIRRYLNECKDSIYEIIFFEDDIKKKQSLYSIFTELCTRFSDTNLHATINKILIKFFSAFIHNPISWEKSFIQVLKYDNFTTCINQYPNYFEGLAVWTGYLLDNKNNFILPFDANINTYLSNNNIDTEIINIMKNIIDNNNLTDNELKNNELQNTANIIINYYDNLDNKFPKMYLLDLVYYVLNPTKILLFKNHPNFNNINTNPIQLIQNILSNNNFSNNLIDNFIFNCIYDQFPPSMSSYVYILMDDLYDSINNINRILFNKYDESYNLGLLFYGCIPDFSEYIKIRESVYGTNLPSIIPHGGCNPIDVLFIFNPNTSLPGAVPNFNQDPRNFDGAFDSNTPLPFNYFNNRTNDQFNYHNIKYFKLRPKMYRPASSTLYTEYLKLLNSKFDARLDELLNKNKINYDKILRSLLNDKQKVSPMFNELFIITKLIIEKKNNIKKLDNTINNNNNFDFNPFIKQLNDINAYIFLYYYLYKPDRLTSLPEFIYYKLDSNNYKLYNKSGDNFVNNEMIGGSYKQLLDQFYINNIEVIDNNFDFDKENKLPPSIEDNLTLFYKLNKKKFIVDILKNIVNEDVLTSIETNFKPKIMINEVDKNNFIYFNVAKLIEEIIKNYAEHTLKIVIDNIMITHIPNLERIDSTLNMNGKPFEISIVLKNTVDTINKIYEELNESNKKILHNFYNIADPNVVDNEKGLFIIYPNEYTNTNLLLQKFCITFNNDILDVLINKGAQPFLLDNNNLTCIHNAVKSFNFNSIKFLTSQIKFNEYDFIKNELNNHKNKMIANTFVDTFNNFIKTQFEEVKLLILSNDANGNNILFNLHNSFKMCFYIINEYISDKLWYFDEKYSVNEFKSIAHILNINKDNINENYLNIVCLNDEHLFSNDDITLIKKDLVKIFKDNNTELLKQKNNLKNQIYNLQELGLSHDHIRNKIITIENQINNINNEINSIERINDSNYTDPNIGPKDKIINIYEKLTNKGYYVYSTMWNHLLNNEEILSKSFNLSLIKILMIQNDLNSNIILSYLNHTEKIASNYFENPKYLSKINKTLTFIYDLLIHLTKTIICFGIEIVTRKVLFNHLINIYYNYTLDDINSIIDRLFNDKFRLEDNSSFIEILYNEFPEIIVKNSINIFSSLDEKANFQPISVNEMLQNLFSLLTNSRGIVVLDDIIMNNLNKNIANYFDLFTARVVKNWYVVCENTLKFIINHQRISNTLQQFSN
jgi:hypothetical protein